MAGYLFAILSSLFFSLYVVPRKLSKLPAIYFSLLMSLGFFVSSVILYLCKPLLGFSEVWSPALGWSVLAGVIWALGFVAFVRSIDSIGLTRSNQWKNLQGPIGVLLCLVILGEWATTNPWLAMVAGLAVFVSAVFLSVRKENEDRKLRLAGIYLAMLSGLAFGVVTVINKYVTTEVGVYSQQVVWSFCIFLSLLFYILSRKNWFAQLRRIGQRDMALGLGAGLLYLGASFCMLQSYRSIPAAVGFTIIQLSAVWTILIGLFVFREINIKIHAARIALGFVFALAGIGLLVFARQ
jgi:drug/metabolite transporter (DMT)-like permease